MTHASILRRSGAQLIARCFNASIALLWVVPLLALAILGVRAPAAVTELVRASDFALFNSFSLAGLVAVASCGLGLTIAMAIRRLPASWRRTVLIALCVPILLPSYILAITWAPLLSPSGLVVAPLGAAPAFNLAGLSACVWVLTCAYYPVALLILYTALTRWSSAYDELGQANGLSRHRMRMLKIRWLWWPCVAAFMIIALLSLGDFAVPDYFGVRTLGADIFAIAASYLDPRAALYASMPLLWIALFLALLLARASQHSWRNLMSSSATATPTAHDVRRRTLICSVALLVAVGLAVFGIPLIALVMTLVGGTERWFLVVRQTVTLVGEDILNSVQLASLLALVLIAPSLLAAYFSSRASRSFDHLGRVAAVLAMATPAGLWALGASALAAILPTPFNGNVGIALLVGISLRAMAPAIEVLVSGFRGIPVSQEEAGLSAGLSKLTVWSRILAPQMLAPTLMAFVISWIWALNDVTVTVLLAPPGFSTLMLRIFQSVHYGPPEFLAALVLIHLLMIGTAFLLVLGVLSVWRRLSR
jgi:iron(III) transport system permease protein